MSQDVSTKPIDSEQSENTVGGIKTDWSVDAYADRLMDELFQDVDRILDGGSRLPKSPPPDLISLRTIQVPQIILPQTVASPEQEAGPIVDTKATRTGEAGRKSGQSFDRLLLGSACGLLAVTLGLWLWSRGYIQRLWPQTSAQQPETIAPQKTPEQLQAEADGEFMAYMERALDIMDRQAAGQPVEPVAAPNTALPIPPPAPPVNVTVNPNLTVPAPNVTVNTPHQGNLAEVLNRIAIALERGINPTLVQPNLTVTIPRPTSAPQTTAAAPANPTPKPSPAAAPAPSPAASPKPSPAVASSPSPAASPKPSPAAAPAPSPAASESPSPEPSPSPKPSRRPTALEPQVAAVPYTTSQPASPQPQPEPEPPQASEEPQVTPQPEEEPTPAATTTPTPSSSTPGMTHTLVGILELGDRSAALFEIQGAARRVNIGERIGSSGWTLVEVQDGEAIIRRNGEVRSIYTGQSF